jgi:hypothetical protein
MSSGFVEIPERFPKHLGGDRERRHRPTRLCGAANGQVAHLE